MQAKEAALKWDGGCELTALCAPRPPSSAAPHLPRRRLQQQLEVAKCKKAAPAKSPPRAPAPSAEALTFELFWSPEQDQFSQAAKAWSVASDPPGAAPPLFGAGVPTASHLPADRGAGEAPGAAGGHGALRARQPGEGTPPPAPFLSLFPAPPALPSSRSPLPPPPFPLPPRPTDARFLPAEPSAGWAEGRQPGGESCSHTVLEGALLSWEVLGGAASPQGCGELLTPLPQTLHLQETVQILQAKVNMLDSAALDQVEARLQVGRRGGGRGGGRGAGASSEGGGHSVVWGPICRPPTERPGEGE